MEVGLDRGAESVVVRDTRARSGPVLWFSPGAWRTFAGRLKADPGPGADRQGRVSGPVDVDVAAGGRGDGG